MVDLSKEFITLKVNLEAGPEHAALYQKYGDGTGSIPAIAFVSSEGGIINRPQAGSPVLFDAKEFAALMGETLEEEKKFRQLRAELKKTPNDAKTNVELAIIYAKRGNIETGQPLADKAIKLDPENKTGLLPELYVNLGLYYGQNTAGENAEDYFQKAETYFNTVIEKYSQSESYEQAHYYLGVTYAIQEKYELSIATLEKLTDAKDSDTKANAAEMLERIKAIAHNAN